jgi:anaerobic magnesium-protoporphyrin IX monomethyl ester cyclase
MAYPGSALHVNATAQKIVLPENPGGPGWIGYSQHAYETLPLPTDEVPAGVVLSFRDHAFDTYFRSDTYRAMMRQQFGPDAAAHVDRMALHTLSRKYAIPVEQWRAAQPQLAH